MEAEQRREEILKALKNRSTPIVARELATQFDVSRQVIVGDIALLRAAGEDIYATPKGYMMRKAGAADVTAQLVCVHTREETREELYTIVDCGCEVIDVIVEHPLYGMMRGDLNISSRLEADEFLGKLDETETLLLSTLTEGIHTHTIRAKDEATRDKCILGLREKGFLYE
ncbi:MAG: transcription repressor NadR [Alkalibacterium sp.]|uniref:transcription repressor NadR n=1 Tax=Alkalibacterium sp. TaxID=1872447 RepID=UPI003970C260